MRIAFLVYVRNYPFWFKHWLKYYCQFGFDVWVVNLANDQTDLPTHGFAFNEVKVKELLGKKLPDDYHDLCVNSIEKQQKRLLEVYDYVVYSDLDEFIIVNPDKYKDLGDYVRKATKKQITCTGREIIQFTNEPPMEWDKPWMKQRFFWWPHIAHFKVAISKVPQDFVWGFHYTKEYAEKAIEKGVHLKQYLFDQADEDLIMVHTRLVDAKEFDLLTQKREGNVPFEQFVEKRKTKCKKIPEKYKEAF